MFSRGYKGASYRIAKRGRTKKYINIFLKVSIPIFLFVGIIFISRSSFLRVNEFLVEGSSSVSEEEIKNFANGFTSGNKLLFFPKSNIVFFETKKLEAGLLSNFGRLEKVEVHKRIFKKNIEIKVEERSSDFVWCSESLKCFFMTKSGLIFENLPEGDYGALEEKIIFSGSFFENPLMQYISSEKEMSNFIFLLDEFTKLGFKVRGVDIESGDRAVMKLDVGNLIFNQGDQNISMVLENSVILIKDITTKNPTAKFEYIDARFGNKMFYKLAI